MHKTSKIYVAGHRGLVGSAIVRKLKEEKHRNILTFKHSELDLTNKEDTETMFRLYRPRYVFLAAARVGGIHRRQSNSDRSDGRQPAQGRTGRLPRRPSGDDPGGDAGF